MDRLHRRVAVLAASVTIVVIGASVLPGPAARAASCLPELGDVPVSVQIDSPRPLATVSGPTSVTGVARSGRTAPLTQVELYVDGAVRDSQAASGNIAEFQFVWDPASTGSSGPTTLTVVACGASAYGSAVVAVTAGQESASTTLPTIRLLPTTSTTRDPAGATTSTSSTTTTSTTVRRPTTTTVKPVVAAPPLLAGQDTNYLRAVQPPAKIRQVVVSRKETPLWPAAVTLGAGVIGLTVAIAPGRRWLALLGWKPRRDPELIPISDQPPEN